jgi:hypothetical protein
VENLTLEALKVLLFILPGFVSLRVKAALSITAPKNPFNFTADALILTLVDHGLFAALQALLSALPAYAWLVHLRTYAGAIEGSAALPSELGRLFREAGGFAIIAIAIAVGFATGIVRFHGWDFALMRKLKLTNRTGEALVWTEVLTKAPNVYAMVACKDGTRFLGSINTFSEEAGSYEIFLSQAYQVDLEGALAPINGPGVMLTRENPIVRVELWDAAGPGVPPPAGATAQQAPPDEAPAA